MQEESGAYTATPVRRADFEARRWVEVWLVTRGDEMLCSAFARTDTCGVLEGWEERHFSTEHEAREAIERLRLLDASGQVHDSEGVWLPLSDDSDAP